MRIDHERMRDTLDFLLTRPVKVRDGLHGVPVGDVQRMIKQLIFQYQDAGSRGESVRDAINNTVREYLTENGYKLEHHGIKGSFYVLQPVQSER